MKIIADANIPFVAECFSSIGEVATLQGRAITASAVCDADILLVRSVTAVNEDLLADSKVKFVGTATIGTDHIDTAFLEKNNIGFASAPGSNANSVAEYIIAALLETGQKYNIKLNKSSIGIIGAGNVGGKVAQKANALGLKTYLNDPPLKRQTGDTKYLPKKKLFDCDFITLHTPLSFEGIDKTFHLADERFFSCLKKGCIFLNTSRGPVADTQALKNAIKTGRLKAAVLDVWENEPEIDTELLELADIATAHIAGYSLDGKVGGMIMIYNAVCNYFDIKPQYTVQSFLPVPVVGELVVDEGNVSEQELLLDAVRRIYDIKADDRKLREILSLQPEKRADFFDKLRRDYLIRREFQNTKIITKNKIIFDKLTGIGFSGK